MENWIWRGWNLSNSARVICTKSINKRHSKSVTARSLCHCVLQGIGLFGNQHCANAGSGIGISMAFYVKDVR